MGDPSFAALRARIAGLGPVRGTFSLAAAGALGLACVLLVSACGSGSAAPASTTPASTTTSTPPATSGSGTTPTGTAAAASALTAYRSCLQSHGDTSTFGGGFFGRGGGGGFGGTGTTATTTTPASTTPRTRPALSAADQKAIAACASLRPTGGFGRGAGGFPGGSGFTSTNPAFQKFEACLKSHGVQTSTTPGAPGGAGANRSAFAACRSDLPAGSFRGGAGGFPGGGAGTSGGSTGGPSSATFAAYQACLKSHGVQTGATNQSPAKIASAQAACAGILRAGSSTTPATTTSG